jgi:hypothetical protein
LLSVGEPVRREGNMRKGYLQRLWNLKHHIFAVLFVGALFVVLEEKLHVLGWLDSVMLRFAQALHLRFASSPVGTPGSAAMTDARHPVVITFGNEMFEQRFHERSPLDRAQLKEILSKIVDRRPKLVVIDLDLSPGPVGNDDAQTELDEFLKQHAGQIVSITPFPAATPNLRQIKYKWMKEMCEAGVRFGLPDIRQTQGVVLRHSTSPDMLANVAYNAVQASKGASPTPCEQVRNPKRDAVPFLSPFRRGDTAEARPINYRYFEDVPVAIITSDSYPNPSRLSDLPDLKDRIVVFGGTYGPFDKYLTPIGELDGVMLHAAAFFTRWKPIEPTNRSMAYLGDLGISFLLGLLFHWVWAKYHHLRTDTGSADGRAYREIASVLVAGNLAFLGVLIVCVMVAGTFFLRIGYWLNPGPMIIGMFFDTFAASKPPGDDHHPQITHHGRELRPLLSTAVWAVRLVKHGALALLVVYSWLLVAELV